MYVLYFKLIYLSTVTFMFWILSHQMITVVVMATHVAPLDTTLTRVCRVQCCQVYEETQCVMYAETVPSRAQCDIIVPVELSFRILPGIWFMIVIFTSLHCVSSYSIPYRH